MSSSAYEVTFQTSDNETIVVNWEVFRKFGIYSPQDDPDARPRDPVSLPNVNAATFQKIVEYCEHHKDDVIPPPQEVDSFTNHIGFGSIQPINIDDWDRRFMQVEEKMIFDIILAANYLDIKPLLYVALSAIFEANVVVTVLSRDLGTKTIGELIKGKSPEEIRRLLNIANDFTPEETVKPELSYRDDQIY
ncbi:Skp1 domain-containing protein [Rhizoctonia solani AG-1 IA]|uniref:Skp1 domain-containing protein n=1 Tax=Thanatephorus cucumeris (strain AG1-IA) TaxID=983506 RepID=L8WNA4_THACA|nr:Skp1 domain-containing protein [Rhizoctonia solani AG-1 IA]